MYRLVPISLIESVTKGPKSLFGSDNSVFIQLVKWDGEAVGAKGVKPGQRLCFSLSSQTNRDLWLEAMTALLEEKATGLASAVVKRLIHNAEKEGDGKYSYPYAMEPVISPLSPESRRLSGLHRRVRSTGSELSFTASDLALPTPPVPPPEEAEARAEREEEAEVRAEVRVEPQQPAPPQPPQQPASPPPQPQPPPPPQLQPCQPVALRELVSGFAHGFSRREALLLGILLLCLNIVLFLSPTARQIFFFVALLGTNLFFVFAYSAARGAEKRARATAAPKKRN